MFHVNVLTVYFLDLRKMRIGGGVYTQWGILVCFRSKDLLNIYISKNLCLEGMVHIYVGMNIKVATIMVLLKGHDLHKIRNLK